MENGEHDETIKTLQAPTFGEVMAEYEKRKGKKSGQAEEYLHENEGAVTAVREAMSNQTQEFIPEVFEWLYNVSSKSKENKKLYLFVIQFIPDLIYFYSICSTDNNKKLKAAIEALLLGLIKITEIERQTPIQVPDMSKPSIYHQVTSSVSPLSLTIAALSRHNKTETPSPRPLFSSTDTVTVSNRLLFLTTLVLAFTESITLFPLISQRTFCLTCTKFFSRGMHMPFINGLKESCDREGCLSFSELTGLIKEKRLMVNDELVSIFLQGIRLSLCSSFHYVALQSLTALKLRSQYEVFPLSIQLSSALERLTAEMNPLKLPFDPESHKTYSYRDSSNWPSHPMTVFRSLTGQVLHHKLNPLSTVSCTNDLYEDEEEEEQLDGEYHLKFSSESLSAIPPTQLRDFTSTDSDDDNDTGRSSDGIELSPTQVIVQVSEMSVSPNESKETILNLEGHCKSTSV